MFIKLSVILFILRIAASQNEDNDWDLAVATNDQVELLYSNGSLLGAAVQQFRKLKALTFDNIRHQFVVSDMDQQNDTIYSVHLTKQTDITPIIQDLPDDVQGLAIDPITDILYWTDTANRTINYISLKDPQRMSKILVSLENGNPQDIAIDVCQRYIYWTNSDITNPTIERATLDGQHREVLIRDDLFMPAGIAVDLSAQRIFWADKREGIYYRIESANLDGTQRQVVFEGTHQKPFGIAVDKEAVYWTDINNNALWKKMKERDHLPEKLRHFKENPMGLVTKHLNIQNMSECTRLRNALDNYNGSSTEYFDIITDETEVECLNGGEATENGCKCPRGFTGVQCETSMCYNFCVHGNCHFSLEGFPQCRCPVGFLGTRCEQNVCDGYCLNDGRCLRSRNTTMGVYCQCKTGTFGGRCESSLNFEDICSLFCKARGSDAVIEQSTNLICRCEQDVLKALENSEELTSYQLIAAKQTSVLNYFHNSAFIIVSTCLLISLIIVIVLSVVVCKLRRRPRVKRRFIVNKNITPLTYRPQPTSEQCEITIENCCNMNICETPCFEPPNLRVFQGNKKDEKKTLLSNMENGEDMY